MNYSWWQTVFIFMCFTICMVHGADVSHTVVECKCTVTLTDSNERIYFYFQGLEEYIDMEAEMFVIRNLGMVDDYLKIAEALVRNSECSIIRDVDSPVGQQRTASHMYRAVLIEPREHLALKSVVDNMCNVLHIPITIFHGSKNIDYVVSIMTHNDCVDKLVDMGVDNLSTDTYNELLLSDELFWSKLNMPDDSTILLFQTDSGICGDGAEFATFAQFDYCGGLLHMKYVSNSGTIVGNGGFSVRNVGVMRRLLRENADHRHVFYWEDVIFSHWCQKDPHCELCPEAVAAQFAVTGSINDAISTWGFHRNWDYSFNWQHSKICEHNDAIRHLNAVMNGKT